MNVFPIKKNRGMAQEPQQATSAQQAQNWMQKVVSEHVQGGGLEDTLGIGYEQAAGSRGKRGRLLWDM
jgi:hypothetical protein